MAWDVRITQRALRDLDRLRGNINATGSAGAAQWFARLEDAIAFLASAPYLGKVTREDPMSREIIYGRKPHFYRVIYEVHETLQRIDVLTIRHGRQQGLSKES